MLPTQDIVLVDTNVGRSAGIHHSVRAGGPDHDGRIALKKVAVAIGRGGRGVTIEQSVDILRDLVTVALTVAAPILLVAVSVGLVVSLLQAVTSIQEASLSFIPKVTALGITMVVAGPWILKTLMNFTITFLNRLPEAAR